MNQERSYLLSLVRKIGFLGVMVSLIPLCAEMYEEDSFFDEEMDESTWEMTEFTIESDVVLSPDDLIDQEKVVHVFPFSYAFRWKGLHFEDRKEGYGQIIHLEKGKLIAGLSDTVFELSPGEKVVYREWDENDNDYDDDEDDDDDVLFIPSGGGLYQKLPAMYFGDVGNPTIIQREVVEVTEDAYIFDDGFLMPKYSFSEKANTLLVEKGQLSYQVVSRDPMLIYLEVQDEEVLTQLQFVNQDGLDILCHIEDAETKDQVDMHIRCSRALSKSFVMEELHVGDVITCYPFSIKGLGEIMMDPAVQTFLENNLFFVEVGSKDV